MQCPTCKHHNRDGARFCNGCGTALNPHCVNCGNANPPGSRFCDACGAHLPQAAAPVNLPHAVPPATFSQPVPPASFSQPVPPANVSQPAPSSNLEQPTPPPADLGVQTQYVPSTAPGGERRQATVLFSDLAGYTAMNEDLDPEEVQEIMGRFKAGAAAIVESHGGIVNQFVGDEVMALFGIPTAHEDDPVRAVGAAKGIHELALKLSPEVESKSGRPLRMHSGIDSGLVVTSTADARDGTIGVTGDTVNIASRLRALAEDDDILLGPQSQKLVASAFETEPLEPVALKGKSEPITPYRLLAERSAPAAPAHPIIGRRVEIRQFKGIIEECLESGRGQGVYVRGHTGIGKSRLVEEFQTIASEQGFACHAGLVLDFGTAKGQDAIRSVVSRMLKIPAGAAETVRHDVAEKALSAGVVDEAQAPFLNDLLDLPQSAKLRPVYDAMDNETRNRGKRETVCGLLRRACAAQPVMVLVEDLHWADGITLACLAALARMVNEVPALLVMTSRLDGDPLDEAWRAASHGSPLTTIDVGALRPEEAMELAAHYSNVPASFAERCIERAAGSPFLLVELLRSAGASADDSVPGSVQSLVLARMDHLDPVDREALQAASIFGRFVPIDALRALLGRPDYGCDGLVANYFVRAEGDGYLFSHALVQEGVYGSLLKTRRRELHRGAADWFAGRDLPLHAEHLDRGEAAEAPQAYLDAARSQATHYRYETAERLAQRGAELTKEPAMKFTLTCYTGELLHDLGRNSESIEAYLEAERWAADDIQRCRAWIGQAEGMRIIDQIQEAMVMLDKAEKPAIENHLALELAQIHHLRGNLFFPLGDHDGCVREHKEALKWAGEAGSQEAEARSLGGLGDAFYGPGRMATAHDYYDRCVAVSREHGFGQIEVANLPMVGWTLTFQNELEQAFLIALAAVEMAAKVSHQRAEVLARNLVAFLKLEFEGDHVAGAEYANDTIALVRSLNAKRFEPLSLAVLTKSALTAGDRSSATDFVKQGVAISRDTGTGMFGPWLLSLLALATDDPDERENALAEGESLLQKGCVGQNYFWFYRDAMEACLNTGDWDTVERYADALEEYTRPEPLPWSDFFIARGRALAIVGRGQHDHRTIAELSRLSDEAHRVGFKLAMPAIEDALSAA